MAPARGACLVAALLALGACGRSERDIAIRGIDCVIDERVVQQNVPCERTASAVRREDVGTDTTPGEALSLAGILHQRDAAERRERDAQDALHTELRQLRLALGRNPTREEIDAVEAKWLPTIRAAMARNAAMSEEMSRRCPGGGAFSGERQQCFQQVPRH
jgi:hypothetical protein